MCFAVLLFACSSEGFAVREADAEKDDPVRFYGPSVETRITEKEWWTADRGIRWFWDFDLEENQPSIGSYWTNPGAPVMQVLSDKSFHLDGCFLKTAQPMSFHAGSKLEVRLRIFGSGIAHVPSEHFAEALHNRLFVVKYHFTDGDIQRELSEDILFSAFSRRYTLPHEPRVAQYDTPSIGDWIDLGSLSTLTFDRDVLDFQVSFCDFAPGAYTFMDLLLSVKLPN